MEAWHPHSLFLVAHDTKILAMQPHKYSISILTFDTETRVVSTCPFPQSRGYIGGRPVYASVGGKLLVFQLSRTTPLRRGAGCWGLSRRRQNRAIMVLDRHRKSLSLTSTQVSSYAVHLDRRKVFILVHRYRSLGDLATKIRDSTLTFDMESASSGHTSTGGSSLSKAERP
jgi:hypothetical protein